MEPNAETPEPRVQYSSLLISVRWDDIHCHGGGWENTTNVEQGASPVVPTREMMHKTDIVLEASRWSTDIIEMDERAGRNAHSITYLFFSMSRLKEGSAAGRKVSHRNRSWWRS